MTTYFLELNIRHRALNQYSLRVLNSPNLSNVAEDVGGGQLLLLMFCDFGVSECIWVRPYFQGLELGLKFQYIAQWRIQGGGGGVNPPPGFVVLVSI